MSGLQLINGFRKVIFWTNQEVQNHAERYSQSYRKYKKTGNKNDAIWALQFDKMAEKTVLKALISKYRIMSTDMQQAVKSDQSRISIDIETGEETIDYIDNKGVIKSISGEQQEKLLKKYGAERVSETLDKMELRGLDDITKNDLEIFENTAKTLKT